MNSIRPFFLFFFTGMLMYSSFNAFAQVEPQFKFYLAFEDATNQKDTLWIGLDSAALTVGFDTAFGDTLVLFDTNSFNVGFANFLDSTCRKTHVSSTDDGTYGYTINAINFTMPITLRWDTSLFLNNDLPYTIQYAAMGDQGYLVFEPLNMLTQDTFLFEPFTVGGGEGSPFPVLIGLSKDLPNEIGIQTPPSKENFKIRENPFLNDLKIEANQTISSDYYILNSFGHKVIKGSISQMSTTIDMSQQPSGNYYLIINSDSGTHEIHPFIKR